MSVEFGAGRSPELSKLRAGAALALVLAAAAVTPAAFAQSSPDTVETSADTDDDQPQDGRRAATTNDERDRIYVMGRRVQSSVATINAEDVPQVVNVISEETLQEQGVTSLEQALRNVPGITTQIGEGGVMSGDQFFIRGVSAKNDVYTDGLRDFGVYTRDSFNYGQIEVFKGPSGSAFGRGAAGGGINTSSKTPYGDTGGSASLAVGEGDYTRFTGDWNQALGDGMGARIAVMYHDAGINGRDEIYSKRWGVAPSIGFGLGSDTTVTAAYFHQDEERLVDYGLPTINNRPATDFGVDPSNFYGYPEDIDDTVVDTVTFRLRHVANDWLTITSDTRWGYYQRYSRFTPVSCSGTCATNATDGNPATVPVTSPGGPGPYSQDTEGVQNITAAAITAPFFGLRSELTTGFDASWQHNDRNAYTYIGTRTPRNLLDPAFTPGVAVTNTPSNIRDTTAKDVSVFANERLWLNDQWSVTLGLRASAYEVDQNTTTFNQITACNGAPAVPAPGVTCYVPLSSKSDSVTPQVGVIWEPAANQHYYLSYSSSQKPQGISVNNGDTISATSDALDPEENTNIELGGRIGLFGDRVQLQGAVFQQTKGNVSQTDGLGNSTSVGDEQEIRGVEVGVAGAITDQWSVNANATWLDTELTDCTFALPATSCANAGKEIVFTPKTAASVWTTYNFTGALAGLEAGGGLTYQDKVWLNATNLASVPSYTTIDGYVSYGWDRFRVSLNGYNLSDEVYFSQVHGNRLIPGQGRTFIATLGVVY